MFQRYDPYGYDMPPPWFFQAMQAMQQRPQHNRGGGGGRGRGRGRRGSDDFFRTVRRWENYQEAKKKREKGKDGDKKPSTWMKIQGVAGEVGRVTLLGIPTGIAVLAVYGGLLYTTFLVMRALLT